MLSGEVYIGEWFNDVRGGPALNGIGVGMHIWDDGGIYKGQWKDGYQSGLGVMDYPDGRSYIGEGEEGLQNGVGAYVISDEKSVVSYWEGGRTSVKDRIVMKSKKVKKNVSVIYTGALVAANEAKTVQWGSSLILKRAEKAANKAALAMERWTEQQEDSTKKHMYSVKREKGAANAKDKESAMSSAAIKPAPGYMIELVEKAKQEAEERERQLSKISRGFRISDLFKACTMAQH